MKDEPKDMGKANEDSEVPYHNEPMRNAYENAKKDNFDQSGMKGK